MQINDEMAVNTKLSPGERNQVSNRDGYPGTLLGIVEKVRYCNRNGDTASVETWLDHLKARLIQAEETTAGSPASCLVGDLTHIAVDSHLGGDLSIRSGERTVRLRGLPDGFTRTCSPLLFQRVVVEIWPYVSEPCQAADAGRAGDRG